MRNWGLLLLGIVQIGTALLVFTSVYTPTLSEIGALPYALSHYRYMLTALWISVGSVYVIGAFRRVIAPGAVLLGLFNATLEILGYWIGVRESLIPIWYAALSTLTMGFSAMLAAWLHVRR